MKIYLSPATYLERLQFLRPWKYWLGSQAWCRLCTRKIKGWWEPGGTDQ